MTWDPAVKQLSKTPTFFAPRFWCDTGRRKTWVSVCLQLSVSNPKGDRFSKTGCRKASQTLMLEGVSQTAQNRGKRKEFEAAVGGKSMEDLYPKEKSNEFQHFLADYKHGLNPDEFTPGDRVWMDNHRFERGVDPVGNEGSNVIYLGKDSSGAHRFVHMNTPRVETHQELQRTVRGYSSRGRQDKPEAYKFKERYSPEVPEFLKK